ncbi:MAG: hypothetical protein DRI86_10725 [Bacteroidetes bacterium]|nr:MAG: hypothetical protein DRI86_10725 [Bacteroidota bacterium]
MRTLLFINLFFILNLAIAQNQPIINGVETFGNWDTCAAGEMPLYWDGFNRDIIINGANLGEIICVTKDSADPQDADYSVRLTTTSILGGAAVPGILTTGKLNIDFVTHDGGIDGGIPYTQKPAILKGWYKYTPTGNDTALVSVWFQKDGQNFGGGKLELSSHKQMWTLFEVPLNYQLDIYPDTMNIMFASSIIKNNIPVGSSLEIDHIWFEGGSLGINTKQINNTKVFPNPAKSYVIIETPKEINHYNITIYNSNGQRIIKVKSNSNSKKIDIKSLRKGAYFIEICSDKLRKISKLLIQ